jgi:hypothetical protein
MKINKKQILGVLVLGLMFLGLLAVAKVQAQTSGGAWENQVGMNEIGAEYGEDAQAPTNLITIIVRIINYSLGILGVLFLGLLIMSGYQWMTAGGNEDQVSKAQSRMKNAIIGLVIVLMSWAITYFVIYKMVLSSTNPNEHFDVQYDTDPITF